MCARQCVCGHPLAVQAPLPCATYRPPGFITLPHSDRRAASDTSSMCSTVNFKVGIFFLHSDGVYGLEGVGGAPARVQKARVEG